MARVFKNFEEMYAHLRGKVDVIEPKEYKPEKKEEKPKRRKKDVLQAD